MDRESSVVTGSVTRGLDMTEVKEAESSEEVKGSGFESVDDI